jgi:hypothetical protein
MKRIQLYFIACILLTGLSRAQSPGNCLHFNGVNNNVSTTLPTVFTDIPNNDLSIEAWIYPEANNFSRVLFAQDDVNNFVSLSLSTGNVVYFYVSNTASQNTTAGIPANQWTHVACTWVAATQQIEIYFNGILQTTSPGGSSSTGNDNLMTIGSRTNNAQYFTGRLDELRIWDIALSSCDIQARMVSEFSTPQPNMVAYYNFNQGVAGGTNTGVTSLPDLTTNYTGTLNNFGLTGTTSNWIASGAAISAIDASANVVTGTDVQTSCSPLTWIDGMTYATDNNSATFLLSGASVNGCDSLVTLDLTVLSPATSTDVQSACDSLPWIDGNTYYSNNNTASFTYAGMAANGCDSTVTLDLTIVSPVSSTDTQIACAPYIWIDGNTYTANNNVATFTYSGAASNGCDSIVSLDLTINSVDIGTAVNGLAITANATGASYQWLDCDNAMSVITGETNATYVATVNGNYAVEVTENGCVDTSACVSISTVGIQDISWEESLRLFPNPSLGPITVQFNQIQKYVDCRLLSIDGKILQNSAFLNTESVEMIIDQPTGIYFLELTNDKGEKASLKIIRN